MENPSAEYITATFVIVRAIFTNIALGYVSAVPYLMLCDIVIRNCIMFIYVMSIPNMTHLCFVKYLSFNLIDQFVSFGAILLVVSRLKCPIKVYICLVH